MPVSTSAEDWMSGRTVGELALRRQGIYVPGVHRAGRGDVGLPPADLRVEPGDRLVLYGRELRFDELDERPRGEAGARAREVAESDERARAAREEPGATETVTVRLEDAGDAEPR
jgi:uncharacterized protein with PhoU and TrkA domain